MTLTTSSQPLPLPSLLSSYEDLHMYTYSNGIDSEWSSALQKSHLLPDGESVFLLGVPGEQCTSIGIGASPILDPEDCASAADLLGADYTAPLLHTFTAAAADDLQAVTMPPVGCYIDTTSAPSNRLFLHKSDQATRPGTEGGAVHGRCSLDMICLCKTSAPSAAPPLALPASPSPPRIEASLKLLS